MLVDIRLEESDVGRWVSTSEFGRQDSAIAGNEFNAISRGFVRSGYISLAPGYAARRRAIFILQDHHALGHLFHNLPNAFRPILDLIHRFLPFISWDRMSLSASPISTGLMARKGRLGQDYGFPIAGTDET
jgi:hypothetical protein